MRTLSPAREAKGSFAPAATLTLPYRTAMEIGFVIVTTFGSAGVMVTTSESRTGVAAGTSMYLAVSCGVGVDLDTDVERSGLYSGIEGCETRAAPGCE